MEAAEKFSTELGTVPACRAFGVSRASLYRRRQRAAAPAAERARPRSHRALSGADRQEVLDLLHSGRFVDQVPAQVCAALLDADRYLCSVRTMYRILDANQEVRERRNQRRHPVYQKPELLATGPNEVWTWDITKLKGPRKWTYFYLYVILDIFSRQAVGWMVADCESSGLAKKLIRESCDKHRIEQDQLTLHADRGSSMKSKAVALLLSDLGVTQSHSRPYVSDDNPFSEAQFKTLKYRPDFPERFGSIQDAKAFCRDFFHWYNNVHYHFRSELANPSDGPLRSDRSGSGTTPACSGSRSSATSRTFRQCTEKDRWAAGQGVDQPARRVAYGSLNSECRCLKLVDTFRASTPPPKAALDLGADVLDKASAYFPAPLNGVANNIRQILGIVGKLSEQAPADIEASSGMFRRKFRRSRIKRNGWAHSPDIRW